MKLDPKLQETFKVVLAFGWHLTDYALDHYDAPRNVRRAVAGIGVVWSTYWLYHYFTQKEYTETKDGL